MAGSRDLGRPDYRAELRDMFEAMAGCADTDALRATVTTRLASDIRRRVRPA